MKRGRVFREGCVRRKRRGGVYGVVVVVVVVVVAVQAGWWQLDSAWTAIGGLRDVVGGLRWLGAARLLVKAATVL